MGPKPEDNFIENRTTGERIGLRVEKGTFVFDVEFKEWRGGHGHVGLRGGGQRLACRCAKRRIDAPEGPTTG